MFILPSMHLQAPASLQLMKNVRLKYWELSMVCASILRSATDAV